MIHFPKNFKITDRNFNPYRFELGGDYSLEYLLSNFDSYKEFMQRFGISVRKFMLICKKLSIPASDLFEYSACGGGEYSVLFKEKGIYTEKWVYSRGCGNIVKTYHNIYIVPNQFRSLALDKIAEYVALDKFPFLRAYTKYVKRFNDDVKELLNNISLKTEVSKLDDVALFENNITIADLYKLCRNKDYKDSYCHKSLVKVYENGHIFIELPNKGSLFLMYSDLVNKDVVSILNRHVFSIPYYDEKGNQIPKKWFEGKQEDAPYFDCDMVKDVLLRIRMLT